MYALVEGMPGCSDGPSFHRDGNKSMIRLCTCCGWTRLASKPQRRHVRCSLAGGTHPLAGLVEIACGDARSRASGSEISAEGLRARRSLADGGRLHDLCEAQRLCDLGRIRNA